MSLFATGPIGSISSVYLGTSRLASHPLSTIQHHENGQSWSHDATLSPPPQKHTMINLTLPIAFPFWSIKVAVGTWRDCIIYFSNNFQNENFWKMETFCLLQQWNEGRDNAHDTVYAFTLLVFQKFNFFFTD